MTVTIAMDSYKGSISSLEAAEAIARGIRECGHDTVIHKIPVADGGEGTVEALVSALGGERITVPVMGPLGETIDAEYGIVSNTDGGRTAVIECCAAAGLTLVPPPLRNPLDTTTYGVGQLIAHAVESGCNKIKLGIGGSATNDGAMGLLQALGFQFYDKNGTLLGLGGKALAHVHVVDCAGVSGDILNTEITVLCDVRNPLYGPDGAAYVYAPQKGADADMVKRLDEGLQNYASVLLNHTGRDIAALPGAGAAGGMGAGLTAFLNASLTPGMQAIADLLDLEKKLAASDLVFTGEGRTDAQTAFGKAPAVIASIAAKHRVPVVCLSGAVDYSDTLYQAGITALFSIENMPMSLETAMRDASALIRQAAANIFRLFLAGRHHQL